MFFYFLINNLSFEKSKKIDVFLKMMVDNNCIKKKIVKNFNLELNFY